MNEGIRPRVSLGLVVFILMMVSMILVAAPIQNTWRMWGLALTQLLLLAWAIIPALILKWDIREVFSMRIPTWRQVFGTLVLWLGGFIAVIAVNYIISYLFPQGMHNVSTELLDFFSEVPFAARLFIMAVMPAVCEEALHRGFILHTFKNTSKWTRIIAMGIIFGLFHIDPYRILGTAILGAVLTYIMVETRNILLPMLLHFVNNAIGALATLVTPSTAEVVEMPLASVGVLLLMATVVPFLLIGGSKLLMAREERRSRPVPKVAWVIAIVMAVVLAIFGIVFTAIGGIKLLEDFMAEPIYKTSFSQNVDRDTPGHQLEFSVEEAGSYHLDLSIQGVEGVLTQVIITSSSGREVYNATAGEMTGQDYIDMAAEDYIITVTFITQSQEYLPVSVGIKISH